MSDKIIITRSDEIKIGDDTITVETMSDGSVNLSVDHTSPWREDERFASAEQIPLDKVQELIIALANATLAAREVRET